MDPLIDDPPFVRALNELVRAVNLLPDQQRTLGPDEVMSRLFAGETAMAIGWPSAARQSTASMLEQASFGICCLPGAGEVYEAATRSWQPHVGRAGETVPLLGTTGRIGAVARRTRSLAQARDFLIWLTRAETAAFVSSRSPSTTVFRSSQLEQPQLWVDPPLQSVARQFAEAIRTYQQQPLAFMMPRIPAQDRYLDVLDSAVRQAVAGQAEPEPALRGVAEEWSELTDQLGRDGQQAAYEASLGLEF